MELRLSLHLASVLDPAAAGISGPNYPCCWPLTLDSQSLAQRPTDTLLHPGSSVERYSLMDITPMHQRVLVKQSCAF